MTDRPIIYSGTMIRALRAGIKTQTRRLLTPRYLRIFDPVHPRRPTPPELLQRAFEDAEGFRVLDSDVCVWTGRAFEYQNAARTNWQGSVSPAPGDRLFVREAYRVNWDANSFREDLGRPPKPSEMDPTQTAVEYLADGERELGGKSYPSMHMPRWASRLTQKVVDVRVQRLQDITEDDARAEGTQEPTLRTLGGELAQAAWSERQVYQRLWDHLHTAEGKRWADNPLVIALTCVTHHHNIDRSPA